MNEGFNRCDDDASSRTAKVPRLRDRLREQTRDAMLAAAEEVLVTDGLDARIEAIASRAAVSVRTLYNYFGDRDCIVQAVPQRNRDGLHDALDAALETPTLDFAQSAHIFAAALIGHFERHSAFMVAVMQQRLQDKDFAVKRKAFLEPIRRRAQILIGHGVRDGAVRAGDDDRIASFLLSLCHVEFVNALCDGPRSPDPAAVVTFFLYGVAFRP